MYLHFFYVKKNSMSLEFMSSSNNMSITASLDNYNDGLNIINESQPNNKKKRKPRTTKENELEKKGFNSNNSWNHPRLKKYLEDSNRFICSKQKIHVRENNIQSNCLTDQEIGFIYTFKKGPSSNSLLVLNNISLSFFEYENFISYLDTFIKNDSLVILSTYVKSWGKEKIKKSLEQLSLLEMKSDELILNEDIFVQLDVKENNNFENNLEKTDKSNNLIIDDKVTTYMQQLETETLLEPNNINEKIKQFLILQKQYLDMQQEIFSLINKSYQ